jgi:hypothetical protein
MPKNGRKSSRRAGIEAVHRFLHAIGALTLTPILITGVSAGVLVYKGRALDAESKAFVDNVVPAIVSDWDKEQLLNRGTPELRKSVKADELSALFDQLSRLGPLVKYEGATGEATVSYFVGSGGTVSASYVAKALFQNGDATFRVVLRKRDGHWMIHNFHVDATSAMKSAQPT